jgi:hypothetical protein
MSKKKSVPKKGDQSWSFIRVELNGAHFYAEGSDDEVLRKFRRWLAQRVAQAARKK